MELVDLVYFLGCGGLFCSEFDIAASVVFVGEAYIAAQQKKQWVFVTDGSKSELKSEGLCDSLLAICFSSPCIDNVSNAPINYNLTGSTVCNVSSQLFSEHH